LIFGGCVHTHNPQPSDTIFKPSDKNWAAIYEKELKIAIKNEDMQAFYFFWPEYLKELSIIKCKQHNEFHGKSCTCIN
jgi:hypothetical protein